ncbi:MAG: hypothetical protein K0R70_929 [Steroidobacteraceae bacterium]|nr:hypothetical protein [Steroidobacteraceae bacterium]
MLRLGTSTFFRSRPALSATAAAVFAVLGLAFLIGWLPRAAPHEVGRGETILMTVACVVIAGYFVWCARMGWRRR